MKITTLVIFSLLFTVQVQAQEIRGRLIDNNSIPIKDATIVLQETDSTLVESAISIDDGSFMLKKSSLPFNLIIQHIAYKTKFISCNKRLLGNIILEESNTQLKDIVVTAEKPIIKVENGAISYDAERLIKNRPVNSAIDVLSEIPVVEKDGNNYKLIGAESTTVLINGKKSNLSPEMINEILASTSSSRVKQIDVYYLSPQRFGVLGSSINVVIEKVRTNNVQANGSISAKAKQSTYFTPSGDINLSVSGKKWSWSTIYSLARNLDHLKSNLSIEHTLNDEMHNVDFNSTWRMRNVSQLITSEFNYDLSDNDQFTLSYSGQIGRKKYDVYSGMIIDERNILNKNHQNNNNNLHDFFAEYTHGSSSIGVDFLHYNNSSDQLLTSILNDTIDNMQSISNQKINMLNLYFDSSVEIGAGTLSYGVDAKFSHTNNLLNTSQNGISSTDEEETFKSKQKEQSYEGYIGWEQEIGKKISLAATLTGEYFKTIMDKKDIKTTLWEEFHILPNFSFSYKINKSNAFIFSLSSEKKYPPYSITTPKRVYINDYCINQGNPELKPSTLYQVNANYVWKGKYSFSLYERIIHKHFAQTFYQSDTKLQGIYQYINYNRNDMLGLGITLPFELSKNIKSTLSLNTFYMRQKGTINEIYFNQKKLSGIYSINNNVILSRRNGLAFQLRGFYQLPIINGLYQISSRANISASLSWRKPKSPWLFILSGDDVFKTNKATKKVHIGKQNNDNKQYSDYQMIALSVRYTFGKYKKKDMHQTDMFRFE